MCGIRKSLSSSGYESLGSICEKEDNDVADTLDKNNPTTRNKKGKAVVNLQQNGAIVSAAVAVYRKINDFEEGVDKKKCSSAERANNADANEKDAGEEREESSNNKLSPSSIVPEYKQILQNLFNMFNNSKRKYPIPIYPYVKGQSSALK